MEKSTASCYPKAAGGLMLVCFGVLLCNVGKANILWYVLTIAGQLPVLENDLMVLVLYTATWPICGLILIFLFLAGRALRANGENS